MAPGWTQPICERDWINRKGKWIPGPDGNDILVEIRRPTLLKEPQLEVCAFCGQPTILGAYVRADPKTVGWPREKQE